MLLPSSRIIFSSLVFSQYFFGYFSFLPFLQFLKFLCGFVVFIKQKAKKLKTSLPHSCVSHC